MKQFSTYLFALTGFAILSCTVISCKDNLLFEDGARTYATKVDSVKTVVGINRLKVIITVPNKEIVSAKVFWNNRQNVKEIAVNLTKWPDTLSTIIGPLSEGNVAFEVITFDRKGNASAPIKTEATILGSNYARTLLNRPIDDINYENGEAIIYWGAAGSELATVVSYTDQNNIVRKLKVPFGKDTTRLVKFKPGELSANVEYQTAYLPKPTIDTFYADKKTAAVITGSLRDLAKAKNIFLGTRIFYGYGGGNNGIANDGSPNKIYTALSKNEFNVGQAYWGASRWQRTGGSDFNEVNTCINWFKANQEKAMVTLLTGPNNYMPDWFVNGNFTPAEMDILLNNLIKEFMASNGNKTKIDVLNVANELFNNDGTYRDMKWNDMGWEDDASGQTGTDKVNLRHPKFVGKAFQYCRENTTALLELRDYNVDFDIPGTSYYYKHKALYQLLKHLKAKAYPVDVVGIQAHFTIGDGNTIKLDDWKRTIRKFKALGVEVYLTELDVIAPKIGSSLQPWTPALAVQQKKDYYTIVSGAIDAGVGLISLWGVQDDNDPTWRVGQFPVLFDKQFNRKPAYYGVQKALFNAKK